MKVFIALFLLHSLFFNGFAYAEESSALQAKGSESQQSESMPPESVQQNIENLKNEVIDLNRDLFILEEDLLFSANTQISVFLSSDVGEFFKLDSVQLKIDDKIVSNYLYTEREIKALNRGGVQRLYIGNLVSGEHELTAFFIGKGPNDRDFKRGATKVINKSGYAKFVELKIIGDSGKEQPEFEVKVWE